MFGDPAVSRQKSHHASQLPQQVAGGTHTSRICPAGDNAKYGMWEPTGDLAGIKSRRGGEKVVCVSVLCCCHGAHIADLDIVSEKQSRNWGVKRNDIRRESERDGESERERRDYSHFTNCMVEYLLNFPGGHEQLRSYWLCCHWLSDPMPFNPEVTANR